MLKRTLHFPKHASVGHLHTRSGPYPYSFHGRFAKEGGLFDSIENPDWNIHGDAIGDIEITADCVLLEVLAESAKDLSFLSTFQPNDLDALWLGNTWVDDAQLAYVQHLTGLEWIDIQNNGSITNEGMSRIASLSSLKHLGMHWTRVSDDGLKHLHGLTQLQHLDIWGCEISEKAVAELKEALPTCGIRTE